MEAKRHWVCLACGFICEGDEPLDKCPICQAPKRAFYRRHAMPYAPPIKTIEDLYGKKFAFGSINSTSSHLMPRSLLKADGIDIDENLAEYKNHDTFIYTNTLVILYL